MNRINQKFNQLHAAKKKAFIAFITAGDPSLKATEALVLEMEKSGVDVVELGVPFSDPLADGPTIQAASFRSLNRGTTLRKILTAVRNIRQVSQIPVALMTYYNPVFHYGEAQFVADAKKAGVDGLIIPDLPAEEAVVLRRVAIKHDLALTFFIAPTTHQERIKDIVKATTGFIYFVSVAGVTGARATVPGEIARQVRVVRRATEKPVCVGFGISTPDQVKSISRFADGVIVGSAIIKEIEKNSKAKDMPRRVGGFVRKLAAVLK